MKPAVVVVSPAGRPSSSVQGEATIRVARTARRTRCAPRTAPRPTPSEGASVAIALGIVAILLVPSVVAVTEMEADYARNCALNPADPDC